MSHESQEARPSPDVDVSREGGVARWRPPLRQLDVEWGRVIAVDPETEARLDGEASHPGRAKRRLERAPRPARPGEWPAPRKRARAPPPWRRSRP